MMPDIQATHLRVVDPMKDEGVWVIVDDGANSCVHGEIWRKNAEEKLYRLGFKIPKKNQTKASDKHIQPANYFFLLAFTSQKSIVLFLGPWIVMK